MPPAVPSLLVNNGLRRLAVKKNRKTTTWTSVDHGRPCPQLPRKDLNLAQVQRLDLQFTGSNVSLENTLHQMLHQIEVSDRPGDDARAMIEYAQDVRPTGWTFNALRTRRGI